MAFAINKLRNALAGQNNYNVLVTILTDGEENASREHSAFDIKFLIDELKPRNWTFTYIGTDHDVEKIALSLSITNTLVFEKNEADIKKMFQKDHDARVNYNRKIHMNENMNNSYFIPEDPDDKTVS